MRYLITGGSGFLGKEITLYLKEKGHEVSWLSRNKKLSALGVDVFYWNPAKGFIDENALEGVHIIINLAGTSVSKRWTKAYKKQIIQSRIDACHVLVSYLSSVKHHVSTVISASAIGYYGNTHDHPVSEKSENGHNFLAEVTKEWENAIKPIENLSIRVAVMRIGFVISSTEGAYPLLKRSIQFLGGLRFGKGNQWMSWIHVDDICQFVDWISNQTNLKGTFNLVSPHPLHHSNLIKVICKVLKRFMWPFYIPGFALKLILGESSSLLLDSSRIIPKKLLENGFDWKYTALNQAILDSE